MFHDCLKGVPRESDLYKVCVHLWFYDDSRVYVVSRVQNIYPTPSIGLNRDDLELVVVELSEGSNYEGSEVEGSS